MNTELVTHVGKLAQSKEYSLEDLLLKYGRIIEPQIVDLLQPKMSSQVVSVARICHSLKSGKIYRYKVVTIIGNQKGIVGCGAGKAKTRAQANKKALLQAKKNIICLKNLQDLGFRPRTISYAKKGATRVTVYPLKGSSVTSSKRGQVYCRMAGLVGIRIVTGNKKRLAKGKVGCAYNYYTALHEAIGAQISL